MKFTLSASLFLGACVLSISPVAASFCGATDSFDTTNGYIIYNNLWGERSADSGSQCTDYNFANGNTVAWHTNWTWSGGQHDVKSFANANRVFTPKMIESIGSIPTTMTYTYDGISDAVADVAFDLFLDSTPGSSTSAYEVMIWLAAYGGAGPISATGSSLATMTIDGYLWKLYQGYNGQTSVYSFVVVGGPITKFTADTKPFLTYLVNNYGVPNSYYLNVFQAGTEPFTGTNGKMTVSDFSVDID